MKTNISKNKLFRSSAYASMGLLMGLSAATIFPIVGKGTKAIDAPVISETVLSVDAENLAIDAIVNPNTGTLYKTSSNLTVSTNNYSGYTLRIAAKNDENYNKLIDTTTGEYIASITDKVSEQDFENEAIFTGRFGYKPSRFNSEDNTDYLPAPNLEGDIIDVTSAANDGEGEENVYAVSLGAKVDMSIVAGKYTNSYSYEAVANPIPYMVTYDKNTEDEVANLPSTQTSETNEEDISLDGATPERAHYTFKGWCNGTVTNTTTEADDVDTCDGTVYQPGATVYLNQTINNLVELKALWEIDKFTVDLNGLLDGAGTDGLGSFGTADVYINGNLVADDVSDYCESWKYGTTYEITDIKPASGRQFEGISTGGSLTGSLNNGNVNTEIIISTTTYSISYELNSGSTASNNPTTYNVDTNTITLVNPTRAGHTFKGWSGTGLTGDENLTVTIPKGSTENRSYTANWTINRYYFDLNGLLDGTAGGNITNFGTVDIYINGTRVADDVSDWYQQYDWGSTYEVNDIKTATGKEYVGVSSGSLTGTITASTTVQLQYKTKSYTVEIVTTNGSGGTSKTVNHGSTTTFSNVKPSSHYHYSSISCTNSQTASYSSNTVTTGAITNNTKCTVTFAIDTFSVQLKTTNGTGATTKSVAYNSTTTFSNVKPSSHYHYNSISCTNSQTASYSSNTVTTGKITADTVCTVSFAIDTHTVQIKVTNGTGAATKTVNYGASVSFTGVGPSNGYTYSSSSCTNSQSFTSSGTTITFSKITNSTVCTITYTDQQTPTISVISGGHYDYWDTRALATATFGPTGGDYSCKTSDNKTVKKISDIGAIGKNSISCTAYGNNGKSMTHTSFTVYIDVTKTGNQMQFLNNCGSYVSGTSLVLKAQCNAGTDWQYGPYVGARPGGYKVTYTLSSGMIETQVTYNNGAATLTKTDEGGSGGGISIGGGSSGSNSTTYYSFTVPSGGVSNLEVRAYAIFGNATIVNYTIVTQY